MLTSIRGFPRGTGGRIPNKRIRRIEFADLPKTISGKIRRVELRGQETAPREAVRDVTEFWEEDFSW